MGDLLEVSCCSGKCRESTLTQVDLKPKKRRWLNPTTCDSGPRSWINLVIPSTWLAHPPAFSPETSSSCLFGQRQSYSCSEGRLPQKWIMPYSWQESAPLKADFGVRECLVVGAKLCRSLPCLHVGASRRHVCDPNRPDSTPRLRYQERRHLLVRGRWLGARKLGRCAHSEARLLLWECSCRGT